LNEAICLLDRYLREPAVAVETVKDVALGDFFSGEVS
jgi:hypothetical protein